MSWCRFGQFSLITATTLLSLACPWQLQGATAAIPKTLEKFPVIQSAAPMGEEWREFFSSSGGFSVSMPGVPHEEVLPADAEYTGSTHFFRFASESDGVIYGVAYTDVPSVPQRMSTAQGDELLTAWRDGILGGSDLLNERPIAIDGHPGREIEFADADGLAGKARGFLVGSRLYQVIVITAGEPLSQGDRRFLDSFRLLSN